MTRTPSDTDTQPLHGEAGPRSFLKSHTHWHPRARDASDTPGLDGAVSAAGRPPGCTSGGPQHTVHKGELSSESLVFYREMFLEHTARGWPRAAGPRPPAAASASRVRVGSDFTANLKFHFIKPRSSCLLGTRDKCHNVTRHVRDAPCPTSSAVGPQICPQSTRARGLGHAQPGLRGCPAPSHGLVQNQV